MNAPLAAHIALLAGLDPTGGAGLVRDCWVCRSLAPELSIEALCTALTDQCPRGSRPATLRLAAGATFRAELAALRAPIWKVGMLDEFALARLIEELEGRVKRPQVVCDPVLLASDGGKLGASPRHWRRFWRYCAWINPNHREFLELGGRGGGEVPCEPAESMREGKAWWIKGVSASQESVADEIHLEGQVLRIARAKIPGPDPRGTGCALSTALAVAMQAQKQLLTWPPGYSLLRWEGGRWQAISRRVATLGPALAPVLWAMVWLDGARSRLHRPFGGRWQLRFRSLKNET